MEENTVETPRNNAEHLRMMITAVDAVISGSMSQREAAKAYNIPRSTLRSHLPRNIVYKHRGHKGPSNFKGKNILNKKEEKELVDFVVSMHRAGFGRTRQDVLLKVQDMLNKLERKTKFENNMPNDEWYDAFVERHKDSIQQYAFGSGADEKGLVPVDIGGMNLVIEAAVQSIAQAHPSNVYHHTSPPPAPPQNQIQRPTLSPETVSRSVADDRCRGRALEVAVQSIAQAYPPNLYHHTSPPPPPHEPIQRPPLSPDSVARCRTLPFQYHRI